MIVFGIGHTVVTEAKVRSAFPSHCKFYGVDPDPEVNQKLFESIGGHYFKGAIGSSAGVRSALLLTGQFFKLGCLAACINSSSVLFFGLSILLLKTVEI